MESSGWHVKEVYSAKPTRPRSPDIALWPQSHHFVKYFLGTETGSQRGRKALKWQSKDVGASPALLLTSCDALGMWPPQSGKDVPSCKVSR